MMSENSSGSNDDASIDMEDIDVGEMNRLESERRVMIIETSSGLGAHQLHFFMAGGVLRGVVCDVGDHLHIRSNISAR